MSMKLRDSETPAERLAYPLVRRQRELIMDVVESIGSRHGAQSNAQYHDIGCELLNYLPEVQFGPAKQTYRIGRIWFFVTRKRPERRLSEVFDAAEELDSWNHEVLRIRMRYRLEAT